MEDFQNHGYGPILLLAFWPLQAHSHSPLSPGVIRANSQHNTPASSEFAWNWAPMADDKDILSGIYSGILSGVLSGISILTLFLASILAFYLAFYLTFYSGILSGIYSDILSGIYADILLGILSGIYSDILSESILAFYLVVYLASLTWALLDLNRECQISVGTARPHCEGQIWSSQLRSGSAQ